MEQAVAVLVGDVQVAVVGDQRVGDAVVPIQQRQVQGDVPLVVGLVKLLGKLIENAHLEKMQLCVS